MKKGMDPITVPEEGPDQFSLVKLYVRVTVVTGSYEVSGLSGRVECVPFEVSGKTPDVLDVGVGVVGLDPRV